ncbi:MAG: DUF2384 domain-containing protein [Betaproteobacteria bacterium]|nr:DUF2384 domain-containing protein [Betaproteobacteria bacterium]
MAEALIKIDQMHALGKAVLNAADRLAISHEALANILGVSPEVIALLGDGKIKLKESSNEWESALLFSRFYQSLNFLAGDDDTARQWLRSENKGLGIRPFDLIQEPKGLAKVVQYLESSRG